MKIIFRYIKGAKVYVLWYRKNVFFEFELYIDVDWVGNVDDKKSTSGGRLVYWLSKKQDFIFKSTTEAKYVVAANNYNHIMWMKQIGAGAPYSSTDPRAHDEAS